MRPICRACDRALGKMPIEEYQRNNPEPRSLQQSEKTEKDSEDEQQSPNRRWLSSFADSFSYNAMYLDIPMPDLSGIKFPEIDFSNFNWPDIDLPDFDFDFNFDF